MTTFKPQITKRGYIAAPKKRSRTEDDEATKLILKKRKLNAQKRILKEFEQMDRAINHFGKLKETKITVPKGLQNLVIWELMSRLGEGAIPPEFIKTLETGSEDASHVTPNYLQPHIGAKVVEVAPPIDNPIVNAAMINRIFEQLPVNDDLKEIDDKAFDMSMDMIKSIVTKLIGPEKYDTDMIGEYSSAIHRLARFLTKYIIPEEEKVQEKNKVAQELGATVVTDIHKEQAEQDLQKGRDLHKLMMGQSTEPPEPVLHDDEPEDVKNGIRLPDDADLRKIPNPTGTTERNSIARAALMVCLTGHRIRDETDENLINLIIKLNPNILYNLDSIIDDMNHRNLYISKKFNTAVHKIQHERGYDQPKNAVQQGKAIQGRPMELPEEKFDIDERRIILTLLAIAKRFDMPMTPKAKDYFINAMRNAKVPFIWYDKHIDLHGLTSPYLKK